VKLLRGHVNLYGYCYGVTGLSAPRKSEFMSAFIAFPNEGVAEGVAGLMDDSYRGWERDKSPGRKGGSNTFYIGWCEWVRPQKRRYGKPPPARRSPRRTEGLMPEAKKARAVGFNHVAHAFK
jgi:hypothetical protein